MASTPIYGIGDGTYTTIGGDNASATTKNNLFRFLMAWMGGERTYYLAYGSKFQLAQLNPALTTSQYVN
jgi:hypothetical protein